jgi:hypothetical protein
MEGNSKKNNHENNNGILHLIPVYLRRRDRNWRLLVSVPYFSRKELDYMETNGIILIEAEKRWNDAGGGQN